MLRIARRQRPADSLVVRLCESVVDLEAGFRIILRFALELRLLHQGVVARREVLS